MKFHILTLFPDMVRQGLNTSIIGRAVEKKLISINAVDIRDFTLDKHGKVDDYPYGGGAGMLMQAQPVYDAWKSVQSGSTSCCHEKNTVKKIRTVYVTPQGTTFRQQLAAELAEEEELIFLCGHYEGIDERVLEETVTDYISIGDYVLTGGELPAMVMIDAISRLVPGVLNNESSAETESFHNDLLEYPQYSRPETWHEKKVPQILLSGNHLKIFEWRHEQSKERTRCRRPDLYKKYEKKEQTIKRLAKNKRENIHICESLYRGKGELLYAEGQNALVYDREAELCMMTVTDQDTGCRLLEQVSAPVNNFVVSQEFMIEPVCHKFGMEVSIECYQSCYTKKEALPVKYKDIRMLDQDSLPYLVQHYSVETEAYLRSRIIAKAMYGAYDGNMLIGFCGIHSDGSCGLLFVDEKYRRCGIGESLVSFIINRQRECGFTPYGHIAKDNLNSLRLMEKLGLYRSKGTIWWLEKNEGNE